MTGKHAHAITYRLLANMIHSIYLSFSTMLISKYHGIPILSVSLYGHSNFLSLPFLLSARFKMQSCPAKYNNPSLYLPCPTLYFCYFSMSAVDFKEFLLDVLLDLTARAIFPVLLHPLSFFPFLSISLFHRCDRHSSLPYIIVFSILPSNQLSNLAKAGQARKCEIVKLQTNPF